MDARSDVEVTLEGIGEDMDCGCPKDSRTGGLNQKYLLEALILQGRGKCDEVEHESGSYSHSLVHQSDAAVDVGRPVDESYGDRVCSMGGEIFHA